MGADSSRLFSPTEDEDLHSHSYRRTNSERREATSTTIDIGFAIRARRASDGGSTPLKSVSDGELGMLQRMVS